MDDLTKKRPSKPGRQRATLPDGPVAADTHAAAPGTVDGHVPDAALKPTAEGAATLANAASAAPAPPQAGATLTAQLVRGSGATARNDATLPAKATSPAAGGASLRSAPEIVQPPARKKGSVKPVKDSFAVPKDDHATLAALKDACRANGVPAKKNQLLRVAIGLLREVEPARLAQLVAALPPTARKKK
ncbi:hypothetical protein [Massilia niabensis]|uniref:Uncharacterized protein n=1 Tax=Massilia niabensis TaxID=544910 RepID=A0ABW0LAU1_9BURK